MSDNDDRSMASELATPPDSVEGNVNTQTSSTGNCVQLPIPDRMRGREIEARRQERNRNNPVEDSRGWRKLYLELRSRRVLRVAGSYVFTAWLCAQVLDLVCDGFGLPVWILQSYLLAVTLGLPVFLALAWVYQLTSEGLKLHEDADPDDDSVTGNSGLHYVIIAVVVVGVGLVLIANAMPDNAPQPTEQSRSIFEP